VSHAITVGGMLLSLGMVVGVCLFGMSFAGEQSTWRPSTRIVEHYETPKPLTKRQKRRLRGKVSQ
jgi:hypothetical protein